MSAKNLPRALYPIETLMMVMSDTKLHIKIRLYDYYRHLSMRGQYPDEYATFELGLCAELVALHGGSIDAFGAVYQVKRDPAGDRLERVYPAEILETWTERKDGA